MDISRVTEEFAEILKQMDKGAYLLFCAAIDASGGELRINPSDFAGRAMGQAPRIEIDGTDGAIVLRLI